MQILTLSQQVTLRVTVAACERLLAAGIIDIVELPVNPQGFADIQASPVKLSKVAWELSDKQLSEHVFASLVDGDSLPLIWDAVTKAIVDFFQEPTRAVVMALVAATEERAEIMAQNMMAAIHGVPSEDGEPYGNLQESVELTHGHSVFVSSTTWPEEDSEPSGAAIVA